MKALSITFGVSVLACGNQPCGTSFAPPRPGVNVNTYSTGNSLFSSNKPWQGSTPSGWQNSPASVWTPSMQPSPTPAPVTSTSRPNPSLAGRSPSEQLQLTKCRSAQSCGKCRQLNCYWDGSARITNRCLALGLESSQVPVEAGQASNLGYCPTAGQQGYLGVNWLAIESSGAAVPNLDGMSDADVQKWLSSIPNYKPDATDSNYPAGAAFKDLLPTAAKAYADGKIPSTTPWVSFFDSYLGGGYSYDDANSGYNSVNGGYSYDNNGYNYDLSTNFNGYGGIVSNSGFTSGFNGFGTNSFSNGFGANSFNSNEFGANSFSSNGFGANSMSTNGFGAFSSNSNLGGAVDFGSLGSSYSFGGSFPLVADSSMIPSFPSAPLCCGGSFGLTSSSMGFPSTIGYGSLPQPASSLPMFPTYAAGSPLPPMLPSSVGASYPSFPIAAPLPVPVTPVFGSPLPISAQPFGAPACCG